MKKYRYKSLEKQFLLVLSVARKLLKRKKTPIDYCYKNCSACIAAEARGIVDNKYNNMTTVEGDFIMLEVRDKISY